MMDPSIITNDAVLLIPTNDYSIFAVLISNVATLWFKTVSGRLKSDIRISATISYNNFPFPNISEAQKKQLELSARAILKVREEFGESSLADLYDPVSMPIGLRKAHLENDKLVLAAFGLDKKALDAEILVNLFSRYSELIDSKLL
jgi:hypothetical protein